MCEAETEIKEYSEKLHKIRHLVRHLLNTDENRINLRIDQVLEFCNIAKKIIEECTNVEKVPSDYLIGLDICISNINSGYREISTTIGQYNFENDISEIIIVDQEEWEAARNKLLDISKITFLPDTIRKIINFRKEFLLLLFGQDYIDIHPHTGPIIFCWPTEEYGYFPNTNLISIPTSHMYSTHLWNAIIHEALHLKINKLLELINKYNITPNDVTELKVLLGKDWDDILGKFNQLRDKITGKLEEKLWENHIQSFYQEERIINPPSPDEYKTQFVEILCDIATVKMIGASDLYSTSSSWIFQCCNKKYGYIKYLHDNRHPPAFVRINYISKILHDELNYADCKYYIRWMKQYNELAKPEETEPSFAWNDIIAYDSIVKADLCKISSLASSLIHEKEFYTHKRFYDLVKFKSTIEEEKLPIFDQINFAWIKRIDNFYNSDSDV